MTAPFLMLHHSPVGAWASLTFGLPGKGICIAHERLVTEANPDVLFAVRREGGTKALPFLANPAECAGWEVLGADELVHDVSPCVDSFTAESAGLTATLAEYFPELFKVLKAHAVSCLKQAPEGCIDATSGGLRLESTSAVVSVGRVINVLYVLERLFGIDVAGEFPGLWRAVGRWMANCGGQGVAGDAVDCSSGRVLGRLNSPRAISAALFVKREAAHQS